MQAHLHLHRSTLYVSLWAKVNLSLFVLPEFTGKYASLKNKTKKKPGVGYQKADWI